MRAKLCTRIIFGTALFVLPGFVFCGAQAQADVPRQPAFYAGLTCSRACNTLRPNREQA